MIRVTDHSGARPRLDSAFVRQVILVLSATVLVLVLERTAMPQPTFDHERLDVYRLSIEYVAFSSGIAKPPSTMDRISEANRP